MTSHNLTSHCPASVILSLRIGIKLLTLPIHTFSFNMAS